MANFELKLVCNLVLATVLIASTGCMGIVDSLEYDSRLLVKVPRASFRETATAGAWKFRHLVDVPKDIDPAGQWYLAWRDDDTVIGLAMPGRRWRHAYQVAPALAEATRQALGVYPLMIEPNLVFTRTLFYWKSGTSERCRKRALTRTNSGTKPPNWLTRRTIHPLSRTGSHRCFFNDNPVTDATVQILDQ